jgi:hypothetical protein
MDDNHLLIEWLAYHYHTVNLRTLVIAIDPKSSTSPIPILNRYTTPTTPTMNNETHTNTHHPLMDIIIWERDDQYMTLNEFEASQRYIRKFHSPSTSTGSQHTNESSSTTTTTTTTIGETLIQHRARQRVFYTKCLQTLKKKQLSIITKAATAGTVWAPTDSTISTTLSSSSSSSTTATTTIPTNNGTTISMMEGWTIDYVMLIDTDEFLSIHNGPSLKKRLWEDSMMDHNDDGEENGNANGTTSSSSTYSLRKPGVIADLLASELGYSTTTPATPTGNGMVGNSNQNNTIAQTNNGNMVNHAVSDPNQNSSMIRRPLHHSPKQASPCIQIPRIRYSAKESSLQHVQTNVPTLFSDQSAQFMTLRYRYHARYDDWKQNRISKAIVQLDRVPLSVLLNERTMLSSIHIPLPGGVCTKLGLKLPPDDSLLIIHHYVGSYEQYVYGRTNDARNSDLTIANARTAEQFEAMQQQMIKPLLESDSIRPWLDGFLHETVPRMVQRMTGATSSATTPTAAAGGAAAAAVVGGDTKKDSSYSMTRKAAGDISAASTTEGHDHDIIAVSKMAHALLKDVGMLRVKETNARGVSDNNNTNNNNDYDRMDGSSSILSSDIVIVDGNSTSAPNTNATAAVVDVDVDTQLLPQQQQRQQDQVGGDPNRLRKHSTDNPPKILVFITTIYSMNHIKYFDCCWPHLMKNSQLLKQASIMVFSNNETIVPDSDLDIARRNFQMTHATNNGSKNNSTENDNDSGPTLSFQFASLDEIATTKASFNDGSATRNLPEDQLKEYGFQKGANLGLELGFNKGWFEPYDWIVRINPDVLIRNSTWLLETMADPDVDGIFVRCGTEQVFQLHTDFFAVRPGRVTELWSGQDDQQRSQGPRSRPFSDMATYPSGTKRYLVNHELTASKYFYPIVNESRHRYLPDADPSLKKCRVRGPHSSVYHQHDSVGQCSAKKKVCGALLGWTVA